MKIDRDVLSTVLSGYRVRTRLIYNDQDFCRYFGIKRKQWKKYLQNGKLHVSKEAHLKITIASKLTDIQPEYQPAMMAAYLAKYGSWI